MRTQLTFSILLFALFLPFCSHAQQSGALVLVVDPALPEVGETYTVSSQSAGSISPKASQSWFLNGNALEEFANRESITLTASDSTALVTSRVVLTNGIVLEASKTIAPLRVDMLVSADTVVPAFYEGGSLPSSGSSFTVTALVFKNNAQQSNLSYLWSVNNKKQTSGAVRGNNTLRYTPQFENEVLVSVEIFDSQNKKVAEDSLYVPIFEPEVYFYEHNPLRGLSKVALPDPHIFVGEEMAIRGEAYYLGINSAADLFTEWKINGRTADASSEDGKEITLRKEGASGSSQVSFHIRNLTQLLQGAKESLTVNF